MSNGIEWAILCVCTISVTHIGDIVYCACYFIVHGLMIADVCMVQHNSYDYYVNKYQKLESRQVANLQFILTSFSMLR